MASENTASSRIEHQDAKIRRAKQRKEKLLRQINELERDNVYLNISIEESAELSHSIDVTVKDFVGQAKTLLADLPKDRWDHHHIFLNESLARLPQIEIATSDEQPD